MSIASAKKFVLRILSDEAFKKKLAAAGEDRVAFAKAEGFDFTKDELLEARNMVLPASADLSDASLQAVAGGGHCGFTHESGEVNVI